MNNGLLYLKSLKLRNYCQYKDASFDFIKKNGKPFQYVSFFGPNGAGKSNLLHAISLLSMNTEGRPVDRVKYSLVQYVRSEDYDPKLDKSMVAAKSKNMFIEGIFVLDGKEYTVQITEDGYVRNDLAPVISDNLDLEDSINTIRSGPWKEDHLIYRQRISHFVNTDNDLSLNKFQLHCSQMKNFEAIVSDITRYPVECIKPTGTTDQDMEFCTDFVIIKPESRVHYKRMSSGERKIVKSFSVLLNLMHALEHPSHGEIAMPYWPRLLLIDEVERSVYYDRHVSLIDNLKKVFKQQQIFTTTHSGILIPRYKDGKNEKDKELYIDLEPITG